MTHESSGSHSTQTLLSIRIQGHHSKLITYLLKIITVILFCLIHTLFTDILIAATTKMTGK